MAGRQFSRALFDGGIPEALGCARGELAFESSVGCEYRIHLFDVVQVRRLSVLDGVRRSPHVPRVLLQRVAICSKSGLLVHTRESPRYSELFRGHDRACESSSTLVGPENPPNVALIRRGRPHASPVHKNIFAVSTLDRGRAMKFDFELRIFTIGFAAISAK